MKLKSLFLLAPSKTQTSCALSRRLGRNLSPVLVLGQGSDSASCAHSGAAQEDGEGAACSHPQKAAQCWGKLCLVYEQGLGGSLTIGSCGCPCARVHVLSGKAPSPLYIWPICLGNPPDVGNSHLTLLARAGRPRSCPNYLDVFMVPSWQGPWSLICVQSLLEACGTASWDP